MRNLRLFSVDCIENDCFKGAEDFQYDHANDLVYIATKSEVHIYNYSTKELVTSLDWSVERGNSELVNFHYLFDANELIAVFSSGNVLSVNLDSQIVSDFGFVGECFAALWSPDLSSLVVSDGSVVTFYDRFLDPIKQRELITDECGRDELVTVGWGSKETQFQGSAGKSARERKTEEPRTVYSEDSMKPVIHWRADAQFVLISYVAQNERNISVFDAEGELMSTFKNEMALEEFFAVKPVGNYIATFTRNPDNSRRIVFYERNGEKRHEFHMEKADDRQLTGLSWDLEASILIVTFETKEYSEVELWTVSNYDWTKKLVYHFKNKIVKYSWSSEQARTLFLVNQHGSWIKLVFEQEYNAPLARAVTIGRDDIRITNLAKFSIPPPMCQYTLDISASSAFDVSGNDLTILQSDWKITRWIDQAENGKLESAQSTEIYDVPSDWIIASNATGALDNTFFFVLNGNRVIEVNEKGMWKEITTSFSIDYLTYDYLNNRVICIDREGSVKRLDDGNWRNMFTVIQSSSYQCFFDTDTIIILSHSELSVNGRVIADSVGSALYDDGVCTYITLQNKMCMVSVEDSSKKIADERAVELGSRLVCTAPSGTTLTMQMPRGNLETIHPRPFVLREVKKLIVARRYIDSLRLMRKHRINMNLLMDFHPQEFLDNIHLILDEHSDPDLVNILIADVSNEKSEYYDGHEIEDKIDALTSRISEELLNQEFKMRVRLFTILLSAFLKHVPPRVDQALKAIKMHTDEMGTADKDHYSRKWLHHVGFFIDDIRMFNAALGTYDLHLTVQVAESSNRDPKEYIPLLNELRKVEPELYRQYRIELVREDWVGALEHLSKLDDKFEEAVNLIKTKNLYSDALKIFCGGPKYKDVCALVASQMEIKGNWSEAYLLYSILNEPIKMLHCAEMKRDVSVFFDVVRKHKLELSSYKSSVIKLVASLKNSGNWSDAATALIAMNAPTPEVIDALCNAGKWCAALEHGSSQEGDSGSMATSKAMEKANSLKVDVLNRRSLFSRYFKRLELVRENKEKRISNLKEGLESGKDLEDIDAFSDVASTISMMSRKTGKSGSSRASTTATMRKRKQINRKKQSLKEGGEYEDSALLIAIAEEYKWIVSLLDELTDLLRCLVLTGQIPLASTLQSIIAQHIIDLNAKRIHIWPLKLQPKHLCGPLHAIYSIDEVFNFPDDGSMPSVVLIENEMLPPQRLDDSTWKLQFC